MLTLPVINHRRSTLLSEPPPLNPCDLGLPEKFKEWRAEQWPGIERILDSKKRFIVICAPTGCGKSLIAFAAASLSGRTVILTATKGLQDQMMEFASVSSDIRGLNNYICPITESLGIPKDTSVADAPCQCGYSCGLRRGGCTYYDQYRSAQQADIVVTNFQCWMHDGFKQESDRGTLQYGLPVPSDETGINLLERQKVKMLIADEVHDAESQLCMFLGVEFTRRECLAMRLDWPDAGLSVDNWQQWATDWQSKVNARVSSAEQKLKSSGGRSWSKDLKHLRDIKRKLDRLSGMQTDDGWIMNEVDVEGKSMAGVRFDPLSPARYAEESLWRGIERIVLVSATVRPKTAELLGIKSGDLEFCEYSSSFDPKRRPTIYVPSPRMTYHTEQDDSTMQRWLGRLDAIVEKNLGHKGIVHCVSYKRARFIFDNSNYSEYMITHGAHNRVQIIEEFRRRSAPTILLSPSVDTGYDFKDTEARWQIIAKLPFASVQDKVVKARQAADKEYGLYMAAQTLVQMAGRIVRSESDWGSTYVLDGQFEWFYWRVKKYLPLWFQEAVVWADGVPEPLEFCIWCDEQHAGGPENCKS